MKAKYVKSIKILEVRKDKGEVVMQIVFDMEEFTQDLRKELLRLANEFQEAIDKFIRLINERKKFQKKVG